MKHYYRLCEQYFQKRKTSDRVLLTLLSFLCIYILFNLIFFSPLDNMSLDMEKNITAERGAKKTLEAKRDELKKLPETPIFKEWTEQHQLYEKIHKEYDAIQQSTVSKKWKDILAEVIRSEPHITIAEISNPPPTTIKQEIEKQKSLYQQQLRMVVFGRYFDVVTYLQKLEKALPAIRWDTLTYEVADYPVAKVNLELSLFYDKDNS